MSKEKYLIDDRLIIPERIKNMTDAELEVEIARLEKKARDEKERILLKKTHMDKVV